MKWWHSVPCVLVDDAVNTCLIQGSVWNHIHLGSGLAKCHTSFHNNYGVLYNLCHINTYNPSVFCLSICYFFRFDFVFIRFPEEVNSYQLFRTMLISKCSSVIIAKKKQQNLPSCRVMSEMILINIKYKNEFKLNFA